MRDARPASTERRFLSPDDPLSAYGGFVAGNPAISWRNSGRHETGGFASPPRGGFALESGRSKHHAHSDKLYVLFAAELEFDLDVEIREFARNTGAQSENGVIDRGHLDQQ